MGLSRQAHPWRAMLEAVADGERLGFADAQALSTFLAGMMQAEANEPFGFRETG